MPSMRYDAITYRKNNIHRVSAAVIPTITITISSTDQVTADTPTIDLKIVNKTFKIPDDINQIILKMESKNLWTIIDRTKQLKINSTVFSPNYNKIVLNPKNDDSANDRGDSESNVSVTSAGADDSGAIGVDSVAIDVNGAAIAANGAAIAANGTATGADRQIISTSAVKSVQNTGKVIIPSGGFRGVKNFAKNTAAGVANFAKDAAADVKNVAVNVAADVKNFAKDAAADVKNVAVNVAADVKNVAVNVAADVKNVAVNVANAVGNAAAAVGRFFRRRR